MLDAVTSEYEGRPLSRPDEEIVDQGLSFDIGTILSRRQTLRAFGLGAAALGLVACSSDSGTASTPTTTTSKTTPATASSGTAAAAVPAEEIPEETAGPFPGDGSNGPDVLEQSGVVRADIRSSFGDASGTAEGVPMTLELTIYNLASGGAPYEGAAVYVWQCDRDGGYSLYSDGVTDQNYLRGVQVADASGKVTFTSIFPGCYPGRWPHVHFEVYPDQASITDASNVIATSQVALPQDVSEAVYATDGYEQSVGNLSELSLATDMVFRDDEGVHQLGTATGDAASGYTVSLGVGVN
jgi:protocatechuate 3,4-dioxygenase beta subunit